MIAYSPSMQAIHDEVDAPTPPSSSPKLDYRIGDDAWIFAGIEDNAGNAVMSPGKVVYWFDLPDLAQRVYVVRLRDKEFMHLQNRDATVMAPSPEIGMPFQKTRHDNKPRPDNPNVKKEWRDS